MVRAFAEGNQEDGGMAMQPLEACNFQLRNFAACVDETSAVNALKIILGQFHCVQENGEVSLLWYKAISANM